MVISHSHVFIRYPRVITWIILLILLSFVSSFAGPGWNPQPMKSVIVPESSSTKINGAPSSLHLGAYEVDEQEITVPLRDGTSIPAMLRIPRGYDGKAPGMVFIHGTGTDSYRSFSEEAALIASAGIVTLVPEKRTSDYSIIHRNYSALALDYEDAFVALLENPYVDKQASGIYAVSEGCFIAPIVATRRDDISYVALISAPVLPIRQQGALAADTYLRNLGVPESFLTAIPRLVGQDFGPGTFDYIDFDVQKYQKHMTMPVFMAYGTADMSMPIIQGPLIVRDNLELARNNNFTLRYYKDADHGLKINHVLDSQAMEDIARWAGGLPRTAYAWPHIAGAQPTQNFSAGEVGRPAWFASGAFAVNLILFSAIISLLSLVMLTISSIIQKITHAGALGFRRPFVASHCTILCAWIMGGLYVAGIAHLALSYQKNSMIVHGGWLLCQICALIAVAFYTRWLFVLVHEIRECRISRIHVSAMIVSTGALTLLLLALAYWGFVPSLF